MSNKVPITVPGSALARLRTPAQAARRLIQPGLRPMRRTLAALACSAATLLAPGAAAAAPEFAGFQVDQSRQALSPAVQASLTAQLQVLDAVGLAPAIVEAMRKTVIIVDPALTGNAGIFAVRNGVGAVYIRPIVMAAQRPILLHELLHAYHYTTLGMGHGPIRAGFEQVQRDNPFPPAFRSAHFLENDREFFAVTASIYLFGTIQQAPFRCSALALLGSDYLAFLRAHFGPGGCKAKAGANSNE